MPSYVNEPITGRKNPLIVRFSKLSDKKYRDEEGLFRIDGIKLYSEAVKSGIELEYTFIAMSRREKIEAELKIELQSVSGKIIPVSDEVFEKLTDESAPQGIVGIAKKFPVDSVDDIPEGDFRSVYLSSIRDPGNLGTMIRSAYAFGMDRVYISSDSADIYSPKVIRASMGTVFRQKISVVAEEIAFADTLRREDCHLYAAALKRDSMKLGEGNLGERVCLAVGNEGHGLSEEFINSCHGTVFIPMCEGCESLNAAAAAAVLMWEIGKQCLCKSKSH